LWRSFGIYSAQVKFQFRLTQDEVDSIATAGFWPNLLGAAILPGLFNDRFGPRWTIVGAAVCTGGGLMLFWLTMVGTLPVIFGSAQRQLMVFEGLRSWGNQWPSAAVLPCHMKNFPAWREPTLSILVVALLKCVGSVGGGLSVQFYLAFMSPDQTTYILFLSICIFFIYLFAVPMLVVFPDPPRGDPYVERRRFFPAFAITIVMIAAILANSYISGDVSRELRFCFAGGLIVLFCLVGLSLAVDLPCFKRGSGSGSGGNGLTGPLLDVGAATGHSVTGAVDGPQLPVVLYGQFGLSQSMRTVDCWLMVFCTLATCAASGVVSVNVAQICESLSHDNSTPFVVTIYSVGTAIGRLASTAVVELLRLGGQQRSLSFSLTCLVAMAGQLLLATSAWAAVLVGVLLSGMANGAVWTIIPIVMADLYGLENLGANYKVTCIGEAVGYLAISRGLAAHLYQQAIGNQQQQSTSSSGSDADDHGTTTTCLGSQCFRETFLICAGLCLVATLAGIWLGHRTSARSKELWRQQKEERLN
jgi:hypothetical protein